MVHWSKTLAENVKSNLYFDKRLFFVLLCLLSFLLLFSKKNFIEAEIAAFEILAAEGRMGIFNLLNTIQYFSIPLVYLWKFTITAFILWVGCFMYGYKITYTKVWQVAMIAETIFLVPEIMKIFWFTTVDNDPDFFQVQAFYPFSLMQLYDYETLEKHLHYPLKALNIFELIYWFLLILGIHLVVLKNFFIAVAIVFSSYVLPFFLWLWFYTVVY